MAKEQILAGRAEQRLHAHLVRDTKPTIDQGKRQMLISNHRLEATAALIAMLEAADCDLQRLALMSVVEDDDRLTECTPCQL